MTVLFLSGIFAGGILGIAIMSLVQIYHNKEKEDVNREELKR